MQLSAILAMTTTGLIGAAQRLPWHLPAEMKIFRHLTLRHAVIYGSNTATSLGKALPGRINIVVSRKMTAAPFPEMVLVHCWEEAITQARILVPQQFTEQQDNQPEIFIIGGANLFRHCFQYLNRIYLSVIQDNSIKGDTYLPLRFDERNNKLYWQEGNKTTALPEWQLIATPQQYRADRENRYDFIHTRWQKQNCPQLTATT